MRTPSVLRNRAGFTGSEFLVVIAIIAVCRMPSGPS
jgi:Tfp pilus assembly protein FimT